MSLGEEREEIEEIRVREIGFLKPNRLIRLHNHIYRDGQHVRQHDK